MTLKWELKKKKKCQVEIGHISVRCYETLYLTKRARQQPIVEKIVIFNMEYQVPLSFSTCASNKHMCCACGMLRQSSYVLVALFHRET